MDLNVLRAANADRCEDVFHPIDSWSETDWATALGGEAGEALNKIKKRRRGDDVSVDAVAEELADVLIYMDLLAQRMGIDLNVAVEKKFNKVSEERGCAIRIGAGFPEGWGRIIMNP